MQAMLGAVVMMLDVSGCRRGKLLFSAIERGILNPTLKFAAHSLCGAPCRSAHCARLRTPVMIENHYNDDDYSEDKGHGTAWSSQRDFLKLKCFL